MAVPSDLILTLNQEAKARAAQGIDITNATIGMFFDDEGKLPVAPIFSSANYVNENYFAYSSIAGELGYIKRVLPWFFGEDADRFETPRTCATPGGTGAISLAFHDIKLAGFEPIVLSVCWPNYFTIAKFHGLTLKQINNFEGGRLDIRSMRKAFLSSSKPCLIINDPCHNPTGYSMDETDWNAVVDLLNMKNEESALILDIAYLDFAGPGASKRIADAIAKIDSSVPIYVCSSFSKTFSIYGLRLGALSLLNMGKDSYARIKQSARACWSNCNMMAMSILRDAFASQEEIAKLKSWIEENRKTIEGRASIFINEANEVGLKLEPYKHGFFATAVVPDAFATALKLKDQNIFVVPSSEHLVRVAFSCVPTPKIPGLAKAIKIASED
ncbi:MAG: aminotransferase class I/II-fold pyridoxal phosphate-dependent enzyme [Bacilli bacterium]|nr:aminotransferase class I/II-fold pyridoxal phosphate-dependent enzyme [Bacilli bacterium]